MRQMRHPSRRLLAFLGIDRFAGGAEEHELFLTYSVFCDRAEMFHGVAASEADKSARTDGYWDRAFVWG